MSGSGAGPIAGGNRPSKTPPAACRCGARGAARGETRAARSVPGADLLVMGEGSRQALSAYDRAALRAGSLGPEGQGQHPLLEVTFGLQCRASERNNVAT